MDEYRSRLQSDELDSLFKAILELKSVSECYRFFEDVCTVSEMISLGQRWEVARQLDEGVTYQEIAHSLNASTATISRVNRSLSYGAGGYRLILDRLKEK
jgi:TrpR-related protein YerC/YecD